MTWPYRSHNALIEAGFRHRGRIPCPVCRCTIVIYQIPSTMPVFLDPQTFAPHLDFRHDDALPVDYADGKSAAAGDRL
jgi:hypothetical protein